MNPQETQQVVARDEKWVPFSKRVKISSTNIRLETTVPQKEETFQCWYSIKKVQGMDSYEFLLANKKCVVNANVFRTILDICLRVEGANFTDVPDDDTTLAFLIKLGYKGPMYKHTNMFIDHMHHPWRTLATIINKCLSGKIASNDKLRKSRIDILWGMFYKENVDYPELMKILHTRLITRRRRDQGAKTCHSPDSPRIGEYYQEYGLPIPKTMLIEVIKQSESYQMFIKYSTGYFRPKKSIGKGSQRKKTDDDSQETVDVFEESESEPESVKRKTSSKRRLKKKVTLISKDNEDPSWSTSFKTGRTQKTSSALEDFICVVFILVRNITELTLEQTQQGVSDEVLVNIEGVEELKRKVKIKGEKKEALPTLRQKPDTSIMRTASAAVKPCQGDSSKFYLIIGLSIPNGDALQKCILEVPYTPTTVVVPAVPATETSPAVPEQTTIETVMNMTPENRAHFESEK
ncbi:hypothetical protein Tco_0687807 [Tanacetum coccineum]